ncbi:MAG: hypothetical protein WDA60_17450 [Acidimicrobiia bacterium]|jgi:hypothetical protein
MFRKPVRLFAGLALVGLLGVVAVAPAGATARSQSTTQGITDDEITVVALVSDLDGLRSKGFNLPPKLTTANLLKRWQGYADAYGPINGRKVVVKPAVWDPIDATTFDKACTQATQDNKPFVVVNGNGYRQSSLGCITVDNQTPMFYGESVYGDLQKASGNRLVSLGLTAEPNAATTASLVKKANLVPTTAKIGILSGNEPGIKAAGDALEKELAKSKYNVVKKVEVNTLQADPSAINRESATAVGTLKAAGADTVFILIPFTATTGYYQEAARSAAGFKNFIVDASSSLCTQFGASRTPAEVQGTPCITTWDTRALATKDGVKKDNAFEAQCRKEFDSFSNQKSQAGVPSGDVTAGGVTYTEDLPPNECTIMSVLLPAIKAAGKNPTWDKVYKSILKTGKGPAAYMSNGEGQFAKNKPYYATQVHIENLNNASANVPKDANGVTFNGCPAPVNCWVPQSVDGQEWFPVVQ